MIVEIHDHKSGANETKKESSSSVDGNKTPFSIHNYNSFITPSPHVPFPQKIAAKPDHNGKGPETKSDKDADKENMPAPGQPASQQKQPAQPKITTVVLFPTPESHFVDMELLAQTELSDIQAYRRDRAAGRATGHPPTPLAPEPPTPTFPTGRSPKRAKMVIDGSNVYEFESEVLNKTCPKLYLEPTKNLAESVALIDALTHPNNKNPAPPRKSRKRTTAELAADEAEAADIQRFMLAGDDGQAAKTAAVGGGEDGQPAVRGADFQTFSRFKVLETIKMVHDEKVRRKKEEEAAQAQAKRLAQNEQDTKKRKEMEANRQAEQMMQQRQDLLRQQQQAQALHQEQLRAVTQAQQMANAGAAQTPQTATQPQFSSPVIRQQTPMAASASPLVSAQHTMGGTPMVATSSNHGGAGSPARPPSAVSHHASMARTASQQHNQPMSRTGTPQMAQGTPVMNPVGPARTMAATPTPRMNQGSPTVPMQGGTPLMMQTPQNHAGQGVTPEQMQQMRAAQLHRMRAAQLHQQGMQMSPGQNMQKLALMKATTFLQQNGVPAGQDLAQYKQRLANQFYQDLLRNPQMMNMAQQNAGTIPGPQGINGQPRSNATVSELNQEIQQLKNQYLMTKQQVIQSFGQHPTSWPQQTQHQMMQTQNSIEQKVHHLKRMQQVQMQMQQGGANVAMGGGQNPAQMQQFQQQQQQQQQALQQQHAQHARQQQILAMQRQHGMNPSQMPQGMMGNMAMMNGMNVNLQNPGGMPNMGGMQAMGGMNMGQMGAMNQQQQQQHPQQQQQQQQHQMMMLARQQQALRSQQQRPQGDGGGIEWSGV